MMCVKHHRFHSGVCASVILTNYYCGKLWNFTPHTLTVRISDIVNKNNLHKIFFVMFHMLNVLWQPEITFDVIWCAKLNVIKSDRVIVIHFIDVKWFHFVLFILFYFLFACTSYVHIIHIVFLCCILFTFWI